MDSHANSRDTPLSDYILTERRSQPRISVDFPVKLRGTDKNGQKFEVETLVKNLSASGLYLQLSQRVEHGENLFMIIQFLNPVSVDVEMARVAVKGVVVRVEPLPNGECGVGVLMKHRRFL